MARPRRQVAGRRGLLIGLLGLGVVLGLSALRLADPYPLQVLRESTFDVYQRLAPRPAGDFPVRVIDIDDLSLSAHGQWPWPRDLLARLTTRLAELGAAAIAFDVLFTEADRLSPSGTVSGAGGGAAADHDALFAEALRNSPSVLGFKDLPDGAMTMPPKSGTAISGIDPTPALASMGGTLMPLPILAEAASGLGSLSLNGTDSIEIVRRVPLLWSGDGHLYPTLSVEALRVAFGIGTVVVLGETADPYMVGLRIGPLTVPTTPSGDLILHYRVPDPDLSVSASAILADSYRDQAARVSGAIVLVGTSASGLGDIRGTPLGLNVPGVTIHAQAIEQMLGGHFLTRSDLVGALEQYGFILLGLALVGLVLRLGPIVGLVSGAVAVGGVVATSWLLFVNQGVLLDPSFLVLGGFVTYSAMVFLRFVTTDRDRRQIRRAFSHYVDPKLLGEIERNAGRLRLGGEIRDLTVMFTDMRGFTSISEKIEPSRLVGLLNRVFGALGAEITARSGTIDKFVGDAIMAFWNAPLDVPAHALEACRAALAMRQRLAALNARPDFRAEVPPEFAEAGIAMGIGISTGEALVGNMGLESRFDYSCIGDTVNLASRIEGASKEVAYDILVAEATRAQSPGLAFLAAGAIALKGKSLPAPIHILVGDEELARSPAFIALERAHGAAIRALANGDGAEGEIATCRDLGRALQPQLGRFYDALDRRRDAFVRPPLGVAAQ